MITIEAREAHEVGNCQACDEFKGEMLVEIKLQPRPRSLGRTVYLCHACARLLCRILEARHVG